MSGRQERETTCVHHTEAINTDNLRIRVNNGIGIIRPSHGTRACRMENSVKALTDEIQDLIICRNIQRCAGEVFVPNRNVLHRIGLEDLARTLIASDDDGLISGMRKPVGVDERRISRICRCDVDCAAREGSDQSDSHGSVIVAVGWSVADEVLLVAEESASYEVFHFGPVGWVLGEVALGRIGPVGAEVLRDFLPRYGQDLAVCFFGLGRRSRCLPRRSAPVSVRIPVCLVV